MALVRKGTRRIAVDGTAYRWRLRGRPTYFQGMASTDVPVRNVKANKPYKVSDVVQAHRQATAGTRTSNITWD